MKRITKNRKLAYGKYRYKIETNLKPVHLFSKKYDIDKSINCSSLKKGSAASEMRYRTRRRIQYRTRNVDVIENFLRTEVSIENGIKLRVSDKCLELYIQTKSDLVILMAVLPSKKFYVGSSVNTPTSAMRKYDIGVVSITEYVDQ